MSLLNSTVVRQPIIRFCSTTKVVWNEPYLASMHKIGAVLLGFCMSTTGCLETRRRDLKQLVVWYITGCHPKWRSAWSCFSWPGVLTFLSYLSLLVRIVALHSGDRHSCNGWMFCISISAWSLCTTCLVVVANSQSDLVFDQINFRSYLPLKKFAELNSKCLVSLRKLVCSVCVWKRW